MPILSVVHDTKDPSSVAFSVQPNDGEEISEGSIYWFPTENETRLAQGEKLTDWVSHHGVATAKAKIRVEKPGYLRAMQAKQKEAERWSAPCPIARIVVVPPRGAKS